MAEYRLSRRAATDIEVIAEHSIDRFGIEQARRYRDELASCFANLAANPGLGRRAEQLAKGLHRFEHASHVIFYTHESEDVFIVRVLHYRMDAGKYL